MQIAFIISTVSTGYLPAAVSAEVITASVPSKTAFATSDTSARVGTAFCIIDSIICVAVMTNLSEARAIRIMRFCKPGTAAFPTSTAKSPRATMMPSEASKISCSKGMASARSILAIICGLCPVASPAITASCLAMIISLGLLGNDTAM